MKTGVSDTDTRFSNFSIEYLCENKNVFACLNRTQVQSFKPKMVENLVILSV